MSEVVEYVTSATVLPQGVVLCMTTEYQTCFSIFKLAPKKRETEQ